MNGTDGVSDDITLDKFNQKIIIRRGWYIICNY